MATNIYEKLKTLPQPIYQAFMADDVLCEEASILYGLPVEKISSVSGPLGLIFVRDMKLADYPKEIAAKAGVDEETACGIAYEINKRFFLKFPEYFTDAAILQQEWEKRKKVTIIGEREAQVKAASLKPWLLETEEDESDETKDTVSADESLPILQALSKYPRLGEQTITGERLRLKTHPDPVRPNLLNWLKVYRDDLGVGYHDPVLRGKFLFQSASCKGLSTDERERLNLILRSIEDNVPVRIDLDRMEIVFEQAVPAAGVPPKRAESESAAPRPSLPVPPPAPKRPVPIETVPKPPSTSGEPADADAPSGFRMAKGTGFQSLEKAETSGGGSQDGSLSFSSRHAFPVEQGTLRIKRENGSAPATGAAPAPLRRPNPFRIKPMGLVEREKPEDANGRIVDLRNDE